MNHQVHASALPRADQTPGAEPGAPFQVGRTLGAALSVGGPELDQTRALLAEAGCTRREAKAYVETICRN